VSGSATISAERCSQSHSDMDGWLAGLHGGVLVLTGQYVCPVVRTDHSDVTAPGCMPARSVTGQLRDRVIDCTVGRSVCRSGRKSFSARLIGQENGREGGGNRLQNDLLCVSRWMLNLNLMRQPAGNL